MVIEAVLVLTMLGAFLAIVLFFKLLGMKKNLTEKPESKH